MRLQRRLSAGFNIPRLRSWAATAGIAYGTNVPGVSSVALRGIFRGVGFPAPRGSRRDANRFRRGHPGTGGFFHRPSTAFYLSFRRSGGWSGRR